MGAFKLDPDDYAWNPRFKLWVPKPKSRPIRREWRRNPPAPLKLHEPFYNALAVDGSTPAGAGITKTSTTAASGSTASFTPPNTSLLVACVEWDTQFTNDNPTCTMSSTISGLGSWTQPAKAVPVTTGQGGSAFISWALLTTSASGTVTATMAFASWNAGNVVRGRLKVWVITGHDTTTPNGTATSNKTSTTNNLTTAAYTSSAANTFGIVAGNEWNALGSPTSSDLTSSDPFDAAGIDSGISGLKAVVSSGSSVTFNLDAAGSSAAAWNYCTFEVVPATGQDAPELWLDVERQMHQLLAM